MALTPSNMLPLGTSAANFSLRDTLSDKNYDLASLCSKQATVIMFICNHCPYVKHIRQKLVEVANSYQTKGIKFVAISSNDAEEYPEDGPKEMKKVAQELHFPFPYLYDETQEVAKAYHAACTPDFYIFDKNLQCVYRGRFDAARPGHPEPITGKDLSDALNNILTGRPVDANQQPSIGCNIKWKK